MVNSHSPTVRPQFTFAHCTQLAWWNSAHEIKICAELLRLETSCVGSADISKEFQIYVDLAVANALWICMGNSVSSLSPWGNSTSYIGLINRTKATNYFLRNFRSLQMLTLRERTPKKHNEWSRRIGMKSPCFFMCPFTKRLAYALFIVSLGGLFFLFHSRLPWANKYILKGTKGLRGSKKSSQILASIRQKTSASVGVDANDPQHGLLLCVSCLVIIIPHWSRNGSRHRSFHVCNIYPFDSAFLHYYFR